jgi:aspartate/methionine/tyrosine aminotransferase
MFSETARHFQSPINPLYHERDRLLSRGEAVIDLISGSVEGIAYPQPVLEAALLDGARHAMRYRPDPMGQRVAREAISRYYAAQGVPIPADQILLTPGTSIAYGYAFQLFADPGDEILVPAPSYPLFDAIAHLCHLRRVPYRLDEARGWAIDLDHLQSAITPRSRAIVVISPHNPTGAVASEATLAGLAEIATRHHLPLIVDEVFGSFLFQDGTLPRPATSHAPLVVTLNGFSKMLALPGMKVGWMAIEGDAARVKQAMQALSSISDTFLPVNETAQFAVPALLQQGEAFTAEYRTTVRQRREAVLPHLVGHPRLSLTPPMGGFYLTLRMAHPEVDDEQAVLGLLRRHRVLVHPGFFYDLPPSHLVLSFVGEPGQLAAGIEALRNDLG